MSTITVKDGTTIYYKDWGRGPVVTFSHGWPLNADAWDAQLHFPADKRFRVIAHDRPGHGRSSQPWSGDDMNGYADDLAALIESLNLQEVTLIGHSTGGRTRWLSLPAAAGHCTTAAVESTSSTGSWMFTLKKCCPGLPKQSP